MTEPQFNGRLGWLNLQLEKQRNNISKILLRLKGLGADAHLSLRIQKKFSRLVEQISFDREKEISILEEIEAMENRHLQMKRSKRLKQAPLLPRTDETAIFDPAADSEKRPKRHGFLTLLGLWLLFKPRSIKHKNQDLTVD